MAPFKPRDRKQRSRATKHQQNGAAPDANATEITPAQEAEKRARHLAMKAALKQDQPGMSSKKKKRLDKYIDTKLRKEENLELIKKLAGARVDTSLLQSSKNLGAGKGTKRQAILQALKEKEAGVRTFGESDSSTSDVSESETSDNGRETVAEAKKQPQQSSPKVTPASTSTIGTGLKRPLELGEDGQPILKKRQRLARRDELEEESDEESSSWEGFSSASVEARSDDISEEDSESISDDSSEEEEEDSDEDSLSDINSEDERIVRSSLFSSDTGSGPIGQNYNPPTKQVLRDEETRSSFKQWATQQMDIARDFQATLPPTQDPNMQSKKHQTLQIQPREPEADPLPPELIISKSAPQRQAYSVQIERSDAIQEARLRLPVVADEQKIMEAIHNHPAIIVCGATGSGKTTQIPQFLFESGYGSPDGPTPGLIGVTQPRRVAAVTMARRVGDELGKAGTKVSYQIRFDSTVSKNTAIKFMTDGILIREIAQDFALSKYSVIVIDEAHERSVNTDILIGLLTRIIGLREELNRADAQVKPLKLVIMSATLMVEAFTQNPNLFRHGPPPLIQSEGRQYPVTMHFSRKTNRDYVDEVFNKVQRAHKKLPPGAMLVFLTGQNEINQVSKRLKAAFAKSSGPSNANHNVRIAAKDAPPEVDDFELGNDDRTAAFDSEDEPSDDEDEEQEFDIGEPEETATPSTGILVLPLYSQLPTKEQLLVFEPPPENTRLIILATNIAETSITIPGVRYVFDCGRAKDRTFDRTTGVQSFEVGWISKASASQRAGRAGRTGPGHCYRLYSSAVYERDFVEYAEPEILRMPVEGVALQLKSMDLQHVVNFPFPTPPDRESLAGAEKLLSYLGAIDSDGRITPLGRDLSIYPLSPRYSKILSIGHQHNCIYFTLAMIVTMATPDLFTPESQVLARIEDEDNGYDMSSSNPALQGNDQTRREFNRAHRTFSSLDDTSDALKLLSAFGAYTWAHKQGQGESFCARMYLREKGMREAYQLFEQLLAIVNLNRPGLVDTKTSTLPTPSEKQVRALKQMAAVGFIDQIAIRADLAPIPPEMDRKPKRVIDTPYLPLFPIHSKRVDSLEEKAVYIHPSSILAQLPMKRLPQYIIYSKLQRSAPSTIAAVRTPKVRMHALTSVTSAQVSAFARNTPLLEYSKPVGGKVELVEGQPDQRMCWVTPSMIGEKGMTGWPLPAQKVLQKRDKKGQWSVEKVLS